MCWFDTCTLKRNRDPNIITGWSYKVKKICSLLIVTMALWTNAAEAQHTTIEIGDFTFTTGPGTNLSSQRIGDFTFTTGPGTNLSSQRIGDFTFTNGSVRGRGYSTTTIDIGDFEFTTGRVGSTRVRSTLHRIGSYIYTAIWPRSRR